MDVQMWENYYNNHPATITDDRGRVWESTGNYMSQSIMWITKDQPKDVVVFCTPFYDGVDGIPLEVNDTNGMEIMSKFLPSIDGIRTNDLVATILALVKFEEL